jgi:flagellar motor switch protein FliN/FliY
MSGDIKTPRLDELGHEDHGSSDLLPLAADQPAAPLLTSRGPTPAGHLGAIAEIPVQLSAVLGKATMPVSQLLRLGRGAVVELDRRVGESIDILVNNRLVARGEVVVVDDRLGVTLTEIIKGDG